MLGTIALLKHIQIASEHTLWHLFKGSLKFLNLATFRLKNTGRKDDFKIVAILAKREFDSEPYDSFVE